jgi:hypothetical protein
MELGLDREAESVMAPWSASPWTYSSLAAISWQVRVERTVRYACRRGNRCLGATVRRLSCCRGGGI